MTIVYHDDFDQGSEKWLAIRRGIITASEAKRIITTKKLQAAANDKQKAHLYELGAQRITDYSDLTYIGEDMMRGNEDEIEAKILYAKHFGAVADCGFITNDKWGFTIGYSPDGLVGEDGLIECKSRNQRFQFETIVENIVPDEHIIQCQVGLLVSERAWLDYLSYSGGMPMWKIRVYPDKVVQDAIVEVARVFYANLDEKVATYNHRIATAGKDAIPTERRIIEEIF